MQLQEVLENICMKIDGELALGNIAKAKEYAQLGKLLLRVVE